ncbi:hypothetical protein D3C74_295030 [compost metagenome]
MAAVVHLEEPVLRLDVALRAEQVLGGVGVDLRHALGVAEHADLAVQAGDREGAVGLREGAADRDEREDRHPDEQHDQQRGDRDRGPAGSGTSPSGRVGGRRRVAVDSGRDFSRHGARLPRAGQAYD